VNIVCDREITYYSVKKGSDFTTNLEKQETDLTADMISRYVEKLFTMSACHCCVQKSITCNKVQSVNVFLHLFILHTVYNCICCKYYWLNFRECVERNFVVFYF